MRTLYLLTLLFFAFLSGASAQTGALNDLINSKNVNLSVDFSNASIHNLNEDDFAAYEPAYQPKKHEVISKLAEEFNDNKKIGFVLGYFPKALFTIKIEVISISLKGDVICNASVIDSHGCTMATISDIHGKGGSFGTKMNLMGDGFASTGKALAKRFVQLVKEERTGK